MSSNLDTPAPQPAAEPTQTPTTPPPPLPPELPKLPGKNQRPGLCCIAVAAAVVVVALILAVTLALLLLDLYSVNEVEADARKRAGKNRLEWIRNDDGKAVYSLTGKSSFISQPGAFVMSYSSDDAGNLIELVPVDAGSFVMGADNLPLITKQSIVNDRVEINTVLKSGPPRRVTISGDYLIGRTEVTMGQFGIFVSASGYVTDAEKAGRPETWRKAASAQNDLPVANVSWNDAMAFVEWLNANDAKLPSGWEYRLPTEAEWEYACRAGSEGKYAFGDALSSKQANYRVLSEAWTKQALPGGAYPANAWGVCDMHGNVAEWCGDWYDPDYYTNGPARDPAGPGAGEYRVVRGGGWQDDAGTLASAQRGCLRPDSSNGQTGFRIVLARK